MMNKYLFVLVVFFVLPKVLFGAEFSFSSQGTISVGSENVLRVLIDTEGKKINAVSGEIVVPDGLSVDRFLLGQSSILLWMEEPKLRDGKISFSGMTPGGFDGNRELFSFIIKPSFFRRNTITISNSVVTLNDGDGTVVDSKSKPFSFIPTGGPIRDVFIDDDTPPEPFSVVISRDDEAYSGEPFISFVAYDKGSGVLEYEFAHTWLFMPSDSDWVVAEGPLVVPEEAFLKRLWIRASDANGNSTVADIAGPYRYTLIIFGGIIIASVLCVLSFKRRSLFLRS